MADQSNASKTRHSGFLPGLVLGFLIGAAAVFVSTELIGKGPKFEADPDALPRAAAQDDPREEATLSREELIRRAEEAAREAAEQGDNDGAGGGDDEGTDTGDEPNPEPNPEQGDG